VWNLYGPTETTIWSAVERVAAGPGPVPVGRPIARTQLYVLDERLEPVPPGVAGALYIGGCGLSRGYLGRPGLTAEVFVPDHLGGVAGARLYRTGDLARYRADGRLEVLGRADAQVKVRGFRIELGEVEAALRGCAGVKAAAAAVREPRPGDPRLVGYVVAAEEPPSWPALRAALRDQLPEYMVPGTFVLLDALPLTPNGKVDRRALPTPGESRLEGDGFEAPSSPTARALAGMWAEVLGVERVGASDDFFDRGGHSLLATQLVSRIRRGFGVELPLRTVFEVPKLADLAGRIDDVRRTGADGLDTLSRTPRDGDLPLSFAQQRLWFLNQFEPDNASYNMHAGIRLRGLLDVAALETALGGLAERHEALRTTFDAAQGRARQVVHGHLDVPLSVVDSSGGDRDAQASDVRRRSDEEARRPFDLVRGPLLRAVLLRLSPEDHVLLLTMHHILSDGWSMGILIRDLAELYTAACSGRPAVLPELPVQYADFARWQRERLRGARLESELTYWKRQLAGLPPPLPLPLDRPRPGARSHRGAVRRFTVPDDLSQGVRALGRREGTTLFMTLLAGFQAQLHHYTGRTDVVLGTDVAGRTRPELEDMVGFFVNQLVLRSDLSGDPTFRDLLRRVRETALEAYAHQDLPFDKVVEALNPERDLGQTPLFQVKFVVQNAPLPPLSPAGLALSPLEVDGATAKFDLLLNMAEGERGLIGALEYATDVFDEATADRFVEDFQAVLRWAVADPGRRLGEVHAAMEAEDAARAGRRQRRLRDARAEAFARLGRRSPDGAGTAPMAAGEERRSAIPRRRATVSEDELTRIEPLRPDRRLPLVVRPGVGGLDLATWGTAHRTRLESLLLEHGAVLFRGFGVEDASGFEAVVGALAGAALEYRERSSPRTLVSQGVYTSTEYPASQQIFVHNENSYQHVWPLKIFFFCHTPAGQGGETPLSDVRRVYATIDPEVRERFRERKVLYVRNFGEAEGLGLSWPAVFQTRDRGAVEEYCRRAGIEVEWRGRRLRTRQRREAVARHPRTGDPVWFNHATVFHVSTLEPSVRAALIADLGEEELPSNSYYGDGAPIEPEVLDHLRAAYREATVVFPWEKGDVLMVDNMLAAHGREAYSGPRRILVSMAEPVGQDVLAGAGR
jgi:non-ribosomal peptide synthetase component F